MSAVRRIEDGGGDSSPMDKAGDQIKSGQVVESTVPHYETDPYEGSSCKPTEKVEARREEPSCACPNTDGETKSTQRTARRIPHRRHEDHRHLLQADYFNEVERTKKNLPINNLHPILTDRFSDEEMESSPLIEDKSQELRLKRQQQYREELSQQIAQREETRAQQKTKKNLRAAQRLQATAPAAAAASAARGSRSAVESYENQLRMEQMDEMRRQLAIQREREVQRLRRLYRKDDRKFLAHLHRLKLQEEEPIGQVEVDSRKEPYSQVESSKPRPSLSTHTDVPKKLELKDEAPKCEDTKANSEISHTDESAKIASPRVRSNTSEKKGGGDHLPAQQSSSASTTRTSQKPLHKPLTLKKAYLRLQQQRREEEMLLEERRAKAEAWKANLARQERLERDVRNMAEWRLGHSLAGIPLEPISSAQKNRFEAASSWLERQRAAQQEKRIERDRQLSSWRDEKDKRCKGVSTYSSAYSLPLPWRPPPKQVWRGKKCTPASTNEKSNENVT